MYYEALRELAEALVCFDMKKTANHQCLFAYLCVKHPELEFDWDFFERVRTKRNGINYYGTLVASKDFKEIELQMKLYISAMEKEIRRLL